MAAEVPYLSGHVVDQGGFFSAAGKGRIEERLAQLEARGAAQMAVLTVDSLDGEPVEDYSIRVAETWQLGDRARDNGVLMVISRQERSLRLEVGYGLEAEVPDARARRILDRLVTPAFRAGDFDDGVLAAIDAVDALLQGEEVAALSEESTSPLHPLFAFFSWLPFLLFWLVVVRIVVRRRRGSEWSSRRGWLPPIVFGGSGSRGGGFRGGGFSGGGGSFGGGGASGGW
jgi:uncharacterized protein